MYVSVILRKIIYSIVDALIIIDVPPAVAGNSSSDCRFCCCGLGPITATEVVMVGVVR